MVGPKYRNKPHPALFPSLCRIVSKLVCSPFFLGGGDLKNISFHVFLLIKKSKKRNKTKQTSLPTSPPMFHYQYIDTVYLHVVRAYTDENLEDNV